MHYFEFAKRDATIYSGGTTSSITASEVHVPGRPSDPEGVKA